MRSGNGRHRRPRKAPALFVTAGVTGAGLAMPLLAAGSAQAADGSTWDRVAECESGGMWSANSGNGYYGGLQLTLEMWEEYGGKVLAARPDLASRGQQIEIAEKILADQGPEAWPSCSVGAGLLEEGAGGLNLPEVEVPDVEVPDVPDLPELPDGELPDVPDPDVPDAPELPDGSGDSDGSGSPGSGGADDSEDPAGEGAGQDGPAGGGSTGDDVNGDDANGDGPSGGGTSGGGTSGGDSSEDGSPGDIEAPGGSSDGTSGTGSGLDPAESADRADGEGGGRHRGGPGDERADDDRPSRGKHGKPGGAEDEAAYLVRPGDSLSAIAVEHDLTGGWTALYDGNRETVGDDPDLIIPGQRLDLLTGGELR